MKSKNIMRLLFIASLLIPAACDVKDPIFNTPHPDHGAVTLTTDWSGIGVGLTAPGAYTVTAVSANSAVAYTATLSGVTNKLDHLFAPDTYRFLAYNAAEQITVAGSTATVAEASGNVDGVGKFIQSAPGWLFASVKELSVAKDTEYALTAAMQQQTRSLTLIIEPTGGTVDRIVRIEGYLTGAASTLDLATGTHGEPRNVDLQFSKISTGANAGSWSVTMRLLGIAGPGQKLNIFIRFADGTPRPVSVESDLSKELAAFNTDKRTPLTLGGRVAETPTEAGFTATITDWEKVTGGLVEVE